jgi:hypothetical protein
MIVTTTFTSQLGSGLYNQHDIELEAQMDFGIRATDKAVNASGWKVVCVDEQIRRVQECAEAANGRPGDGPDRQSSPTAHQPANTRAHT